MDISKLLEQLSSIHSQKTALIQGDTKISYESLNRQVSSLAAHLKNIVIEKGDKVAVMFPNRIEFVVSYFAAIRCGGVAVTLNVMSTPYEMSHFLNDSDAKIIITTSDYAKRYEEIRDSLVICKQIIVLDSIDDIPQVNPVTFPELNEQDVAVMIYTAGLTGNSFGVELTHGNLLSQTPLINETFNATADDRALAIIPYFHSFGAVANLLSIIAVGGSVVLLERFSIDSIFATIAKERVTYIAAVPRLFLGMLFHEKAERYDTSSLRFLVTGGSAMPVEVFPAFEQKFGIKIHEGYGLTEASPVCAVCNIDMPHKPGSIGVPISAIKAKIVDENGNELPSGTIGELIISGPNVMKGYYKQPEATSNVLKNGWLYTGDLAKQDDDGYLYIAGLKKRMIITSGFNVYPQEVEQVLEIHPAVAKATVTGKPDLMRGELVCVKIELKDGSIMDEKEILRFCRQHLSNYKVPREISITTK